MTVVGIEETGSSANYWTGGADIWWNNPLKWSENVVPDINTDVVIPDVTNDPVIGAGAFCRNITIKAGATLTLPGLITLTVSGDWTNDGYFSPTGAD